MSEYATIARPYAQAAFDFAKEHSAVDQWLFMIDFMSQAVSNEEVASFIDSSAGNASVTSLLLRLSEGYVDGYGQNFLRQLVENHRLKALPDILAEFRRLKDEDERILHAEVVSAEPLPDAEMARITAFLKDKYSRTVSAVNTVDESILGGVVIKTPDEIIDASVRSRIDELALALKS